MRFSKIKDNDIANGLGITMSFWTQGCPHHCKGCFNKETWDFHGGQEFKQE
ncbi:4Fe-4S cluster-binding domain-containing protein, partial [Acinetobacter sp. RIT592]